MDTTATVIVGVLSVSGIFLTLAVVRTVSLRKIIKLLQSRPTQSIQQDYREITQPTPAPQRKKMRMPKLVVETEAKRMEREMPPPPVEQAPPQYAPQQAAPQQPPEEYAAPPQDEQAYNNELRRRRMEEERGQYEQQPRYR